MVEGLGVFFEPRSVAVIGASEKLGTIGRAIMTNLLGKFRGRVIPVNIKYDRVFGLRCYRSIRDVPEDVDLAVIAVPAKAVPRVAEECGEKGVRGLIVISAGFREVGEEGARLERELVSIIRRFGMRMIGPNCLGVYDAYTGLDTVFNPDEKQGKPGPGGVAFISQSGALGAAILDWLARAGVGMSKFVSYGNAADVKEYELIEYLAQDPRTQVIAAYIEGVEDGRRFVEAVEKAVEAGKPVVVLKAGKTERGARAATSHTGALAGSYEVYYAALRQSGAVVAEDLEELFAAIKALSTLPQPKGPRVAIVTNGGGAGVLATDAIERSGLVMAELPSETIEELRRVLPPAASPLNPVDILGDAPAERYSRALEIVAHSGSADMILVIALLQSPALDGSALVKVLAEAARSYGKPIVAVMPGGEYSEKYMAELEKSGVPAFKTPAEGVKALRLLYSFVEGRRRVLARRSAVSRGGLHGWGT